MKAISNFILLLMLMSSIKAQQTLVFTNTHTGQQFFVSEGTTLVARYKGYLGQEEVVKNMVTRITDSTVVFVSVPQNAGFMDKMRWEGSHEKVVRIADLVAFRRISIWRQLGKAVFSVGVISASYILLFDYMNQSNYSTGAKFGMSIGVGMISYAMIEALFPENTKHKLSDGWAVTVINE